MADEPPSRAGFLGLLAVGLGVCCGLPLLISIGLLGALAGLSIGAWVLVAAGLALVVVGVIRGRSRARDMLHVHPSLAEGMNAAAGGVHRPSTG